MKLTYSIILACLPVLAIASVVFISFKDKKTAWSWPDWPGWVALIIGVAVALVQILKDTNEWRAELNEKAHVLELKERQNASALWELEALCNTVNMMLNQMAIESRVSYPCQEDVGPNWYFVHYRYRENLVALWTYKNYGRQNDFGDTASSYNTSLLQVWRSMLDDHIAKLDRQHELVNRFIREIRQIERQLNSNWGISDLTDAQRQDFSVLKDCINLSLQDVVNSAERIYPNLIKEAYSDGRKRCSEISDLRFPNRKMPFDLVFDSK